MTDHQTKIQSITDILKIKCVIKITSIGRKVFFDNADDKHKFIEHLKSTKVLFFTHPDDSHKIFKAILSGLPEIETKVIDECLLKEHGLTSTKTVMFNTTASSKLYLCHFNKSDVNMKNLNNVRSVYHHIVKWLAYKPKRSAPTQCLKCLMYGHGLNNCNRFAVCMLCSGNHLTKVCTVIKDDTTNPKYKCFNCKSADLPHDHKANDPNCPFRAKYEASKEYARNRNKKPPLQPRNNTLTHTMTNQRFIPAPTPPPFNHVSFAAVAAQPDTNSRTHTSASNSSNMFTGQNNNNNGLWTFNEVANLLLDSINELQQCKSKLDQLKVITNLLQHACT